MKKKTVIFIIITMILVFTIALFLSIKKNNIINNEWNMKITEGFIGSRVFYFYDNNKLIVDDSFHGINELEWKEDINLNQIYNYVQNYKSEKNSNEEFIIELKNGTKKHVNPNDEYMKAFFECFWNYILK